jgi:hypothetical protein
MMAWRTGHVRRSADRKQGEALGGAGARQEGENVDAQFYARTLKRFCLSAGSC